VISWLALSLSMIGIYLNAKKRSACWPVYIVADGLWMLDNIHRPAETILWCMFCLANVYAWREWRK
jgi:hypothetical protein